MRAHRTQRAAVPWRADAQRAGAAPLAWAGWHGCAGAAAALLSVGADPRSEDAFQGTAGHWVRPAEIGAQLQPLILLGIHAVKCVPAEKDDISVVVHFWRQWLRGTPVES